MHRHWLERAFAAFVLVWFVVVTTEPAVLHSCPVHGPVAGAAVAAEQHGAGHSDASRAPDDHHAACTCVGDCSAGGFSVGLLTAEQRLVAATPRNSRAAPTQADLPRITAPPFLLPYANGPPGIRIVA